MTGAALPTTPPDRTAARTVATLVVLTLAGAALGVASELAGYLPHPWEYLSQLAAPWLVLTFGAGRPWRRARTGAVCGVAVILIGLVAYALFKAVAYGDDSVRPLLGEWPFWVALAVGLGVPAGAAGALTSARRPALAVLAWSVPLAGLLAEVAAIVLGYLPWGMPLALLEVAAAPALATWVTRHVRIGPLALATLVLTGVAAVLVPVVQGLSPVSGRPAGALPAAVVDARTPANGKERRAVATTPAPTGHDAPRAADRGRRGPPRSPPAARRSSTPSAGRPRSTADTPRPRDLDDGVPVDEGEGTDHWTSTDREKVRRV